MLEITQDLAFTTAPRYHLDTRPRVKRKLGGNTISNFIQSVKRSQCSATIRNSSDSEGSPLSQWKECFNRSAQIAVTHLSHFLTKFLFDLVSVRGAQATCLIIAATFHSSLLLLNGLAFKSKSPSEADEKPEKCSGLNSFVAK